jgi:hypothetical protein
MCEPVTAKRGGWRGWPELPAPEASRAAGGWIDLSHPITEALSRAPFFPRPRIRRIKAMPEDPMNLTEIQMVCHHGTHIDAPRHFIADGPAVDGIPLERLYGPGVVWHIDAGALGVIEPKHLEAATPEAQEGDIVLLDTGWARHVNTERYEDHPRPCGQAPPRRFRLAGAPHPARPRHPDRRACDRPREPSGAARRGHVHGAQHRRIGRRAGPRRRAPARRLGGGAR